MEVPHGRRSPQLLPPSLTLMLQDWRPSLLHSKVWLGLVWFAVSPPKLWSSSLGDDLKRQLNYLD